MVIDEDGANSFGATLAGRSSSDSTTLCDGRDGMKGDPNLKPSSRASDHQEEVWPGSREERKALRKEKKRDGRKERKALRHSRMALWRQRNVMDVGAQGRDGIDGATAWPSRIAQTPTPAQSAVSPSLPSCHQAQACRRCSYCKTSWLSSRVLWTKIAEDPVQRADGSVGWHGLNQCAVCSGHSSSMQSLCAENQTLGKQVKTLRRLINTCCLELDTVMDGQES